MGPVLPSAMPGGVVYQNLWDYLLDGGVVCAALWVVVVGCHTPHSAGTGEHP